MSIHSRKTGGQTLDLAALRARLDGQTGPRFWRGLEELAGTPEFERFLHREFPEQASEWSDPTSRRNFLRLMGASLALAGVGLAGCDTGSTPPEKILPYVRQPEQLVLGRPLHYATAVTLGGVATGVVAETHEGRPTMLEGNEKHPDSLGAIDPLTQASLLGLYDPDRSQVVMKGKGISTFDSFLFAAVNALDAQRPKQGAGLQVLTETVTSPSLARQIRALLKEFPKARWRQYEPAAPHSARAGARLAFGRDVAPQYHLEHADVILALDADFLATGPGHLRMARAFGGRRGPSADGPGMSRLYAVEPTVTVTGSTADHRLRLRSQEVAAFATALARTLGVAGVPEPPKVAAVEANGRWLDAAAKDLQAHKGRAVVIAGDGQPAYVHALAHAVNAALGSVGKDKPVTYTEPVEAEPADQPEALAELCKAMADGEVDALIVLGGNLAYTAPADSGFAEGLKKVKFKARLGLYEDETSALCDWHIPQAHELETWGDARATDGTATVQQPLIAPLFGGRSAIELVAALLKHPDRTGHEIVRATWRERAPQGQDFEKFWRTAVHEGVVPDSAAKVVEVAPKADLGAPPPAPAEPASGTLEAIFRPDPSVWDGRYTNNGWLQELPRPLTKLVWDNAAIISLATAERLGVSSSETTRECDVVALTFDRRTIEAPVWVLPGQADGVVTLHLGYGRGRTGRVGTGTGFNANALRTAATATVAPNVSVRKTGRTVRLASTQLHRSLEGRDLYRVGTLAEYKEHNDFAQHQSHAHPPERDQTLIPAEAPDYVPGANDYQWGMVVDLNSCTGCGHCVLACVAENNIPVVGKEEVLNQREMHWLEVDQYFEGRPDDPSGFYHQPRLCMHCEKAPCEVVCPVAATLHDTEGLNVMVYNRCVGTRYCSNNCPYKVRHFNFLQYSDLRTPSLALLNNPDVTVRARGVMEKCSYCVQRINQARYQSELEGRRIRDGEIVTACQAACPTRAITFGDTADPDTAVSKLKKDPRNYGMLAELNTRPRTTYLAKVRNVNPEIPTGTEKTEPRHGV
jgi:molybdopterin-containing oxidoreductase family iron-sulfur binding subunit